MTTDQRWTIVAIVTALGLSTINCAALNTPAAKVVENVVIDLAKAQCVNELDEFDPAKAAILCDVAEDIATKLIRSKVVGMNRVAARRGGYKKAYGEE